MDQGKVLKKRWSFLYDYLSDPVNLKNLKLQSLSDLGSSVAAGSLYSPYVDGRYT